MKFLIAFALFAVAFADVEPFRLREAPAPAIDRSIDYPYLVKIVESNIANTVKVVDFVNGEPTKGNPIGGVKATFEEADPTYDGTVKFVDEAVNEEHVDNDSSLVKVVESPLEAAAPSDLAVTVVDEAVLDSIDEESPLEKAGPVYVVDEAVNDSIDEESLLENAGPVSFVHEAVNNMISDAEVAPSFHSYAGISKLIRAAQEQKNVEGSSTDIVGSPEVLTVPTAVYVVETGQNMGHILAVDIEDTFEDSVDVHAKPDYGNPANIVNIEELLRGKVFNNPMLR